jgi:CheY-like chemotaxis protein
VLIVDDNYLNRFLLRKTLRTYHATVDTASNAKTALKKLNTITYQIILLDIHMPNMNGYELAALIRQKLKLTTPIIATTASTYAEVQEQATSAGINDCVMKPIVTKELIEKIELLLQKKTETNHYIELIKKDLNTTDNAVVNEVIKIVKNNLPKDLCALKEAIQLKEYKKIELIAHKMRSTIKYFQLTKGDQLLNKIEQSAKEVKDIEKMETHYANVSIICEKLIADL